MGGPRPWLLSEINIAARAILATERAAARARMVAGTLPYGKAGSEALAATAARWGKGWTWLDWILKVHDAAAADPLRFGPAVALMDRTGMPKPAWLWLQANRDRPIEALTPLPAEGRARETITEDWLPSDVSIAARALLQAAVAPHDSGGTARLIDPARHHRALGRIARLWGKKADWLQKVLELCEAAEREPARFSFLVDAMDRSRNPRAPFGRYRRILDEARVERLVPVEGRFHTLIFDVPWQEDNISEACDHDYALMSFDEILGLKPLIDAWAAEDFTHLWFWAKNNTTGLAHKALEHYGFSFKISHIWHKPRWGQGRYARNKHETVLFATRGERGCKDAYTQTPTVHDWPRPAGPESSKPDGFYEMVRALSYPPYGEGFQRTPRAGFTNLYQMAQAPLLEAAE
jgi:N6-adenosine-specific RNA methylase IME4